MTSCDLVVLLTESPSGTSVLAESLVRHRFSVSPRLSSSFAPVTCHRLVY